jgi:3-hydroxyisobutyrate dehydrogenase-like beta-hydroxyacid dehydrogenase
MAEGPIGFVGVGRMGGRMARRLTEAGHRLVVHDRSADAVAAMQSLGAEAADSPAAVASAAEIVLASLPTPPVVESVALGPAGIIEGTRVKIFADTSTTGAACARRIADGLAARGIVAADAPVSGGLAGAAAGTLALMLACPEDVFSRLKPIMGVLGKPFFIGSRPGQGQTMKLLNNLLSATALAVSAEALVLGVKAGLDARQIIDVINAGTGKNSATETKIPKAVLPRTFDMGFPVSLLDKDVRLCLEEATALGVPMVVGTAVRQLLAITSASEGPEADMTEVVRTLERWAGVEVGSRS